MDECTPAQRIKAVVESHKTGDYKGMFSICSANRYVLEAAILQALRDDSCVLIESTSNQVNQFGGYTGMTPAEFRDYVLTIAASFAFPAEKIILGGDHLGPNAWRSEPAEEAMRKACDLVRDCVKAGYRKIHLDASMNCADDPQGALADEVVAGRAAQLCKAAEAAAADVDLQGEQVYVIGTEVPPPGGALEHLDGVPPTSVDGAARTVKVNREAFERLGLSDAWARVVALVVQPGVEFSDDSVIEYNRPAAVELSRMVETEAGLVFEAHSTDYQPAKALKALVEDHFAILKVGPWLTFAFREAVFALESIERELVPPPETPSNIRNVLDNAMLADPSNWAKHCLGSPEEQAFARTFGLSDRSRYYWPVPDVQAALEQLLDNLAERSIPLGLLSQYLPVECEEVVDGMLSAEPENLIRYHIMTVLDYYADAC